MKHNRIFRQGAMLAAGAVLTAGLTLFASAATAYPLGDIDLDGSVAAADLTALSCAVARMNALDAEGYTLGADGTVYEIGDITLDGDVTAADLTALARHMGGIETLPTDAVTYAGVYSGGNTIIHQSTDGYESDTTTAAAAFDGDLSTGWQSATEQDGDYIGLTFADTKTMDSVSIVWAENERANTTNTGYTVQYTTDGTTWQAVPEADYDFGTPVSGTTTDVVSFTVIRATGFRVVIHQGTSDKYAPKIHELTFHEVVEQRGTVLWQSQGGTDDDKTGTAAFDGDLSTGWQSASKVSGDYVGFTFPAATLKAVMIDWEASTRAAASPSGYTVQYTVNGTDWAAVSSAQYIFGQDVDGIATDTVRFAPVTATGIRVVVQEFTSDKYAAKVYEIGVATEAPLTGTVISSSAGGTDGDKTGAAAVDSSLATGWQSLTSVSGDYIGMTFDRQLVRSAIINWESVTRPTATAGGYVVQYTTDGSSWKE